MLDGMFYIYLNMSIMVALLVVLLLIVKFVLGRWMHKAAIYSLWGIVAFRLLIPISISSEWSLINLINKSISKAIAVPVIHESIDSISIMNSVQLAEEYFPMEYKTNFVKQFFSISSIVWIIGGAIFVMMAVVIYAMTLRYLNTAVLMEKNSLIEKCKKKMKVKGHVSILQSSRVNTPIVLGVMNPRIIIPEGISDDDLEYVLLHELSHIKRKDNLWKLISVFAVCIHWFNPFAWLFLYISSRDLEIACDERVLKNIKNENRKNYANTIIALAEKQRITINALGSTAVKKRIITISNYKNISIMMIVFTSLSCIVLTVVLITNPIL